MVWGLVTLPDGTILFNERDAHDIVHLDPKTGTKTSIGTVPNAQSTDGGGGLTGLEINPVSYATDHWLYIMHTSPTDNRIVRIQYNEATDTLQTNTEQVLLAGIERNKYHNGGRLRFSPDGKYLYAGTGDAQNGANAQNTAASTARCCASTRTARSRRTTRSTTRSSVTGTATSKGWRSTRRAGCGSRSSATTSWTKRT